MSALLQLMRFDRPIGTILLLWPTLSALWLAHQGFPGWRLLMIFILGVIIMRAAGCVINDIADRHIDGHVKRTAQRPLPTGAVSTQSALLLFIVLISIALLLTLLLNRLSLLIAIIAGFLTLLYPFTKRFFNFPQLIFALAWSSSILMAFAAGTSSLPLIAWLFYFAQVCFSIAYDTEYALVDRDDDEKIGVRSSARLLGRYAQLGILSLQALAILLFALIGLLMNLSITYYLGLIIIIGLFVYQHRLIAQNQREFFFKAFIHNHWVGLVLWLAIVLP